MSIEALPVTFQRVIPSEFMDDMGHMNVMWYSHLFSEATFRFFSQFGMDANYFASQGTGAFALQAHVRYLAEVFEDERLTIRTRAVARSSRRFRFIHFMRKDGANELAATCEFLGAHVDRKSRKMSNTPREICDSFDQILGEHETLDWEPPLCKSINLMAANEQ